MKIIFDIDSRLKYKTPFDLIDTPVTIRVTEFNENGAKDFAEQMAKAHLTHQPIIPIIIDSYGGHVYSLLAMIAEINASKIPVATICIGKAMSCGAVLLSYGTEGYRFADEDATIMIHDVSSMHFGKNEELKASAKQTDKLQKQLFTAMARNCGHPPDYFLNIIHEKSHVEWYLTAKEAKKHKLVNQIKVPNFKAKIQLSLTME